MCMYMFRRTCIKYHEAKKNEWRKRSASNFLKSNQIRIVITLFPIRSAPDGIPFGAKSIGKLLI